MDNFQRMFSCIYSFPEQLKEAIEIGTTYSPQQTLQNNINSIIFAGMGGSGIAGEVVTASINKYVHIPIICVKGYSLPEWVNNTTLVILCSYSGTTEETISCFHDAKKKTANIVGITGGGTLEKLLHKNNHDCIKIPSGMQPRAALGYLSIPLYFYLWKIKLIPTDILDLISTLPQLLESVNIIFSTRSDVNKAFTIAQQLYTRSPVFYGENDTTYVAATRWRTQLAENSKMLSSSHVLPELCHNELETFKMFNHLDNKAIVWLLDSDMNPRNKKRYEACKKIISSVVPLQIEIEPEGSSFIERLFYLLYMGDWVSYWIAELRKIDPITIPNISFLRNAMKT